MIITLVWGLFALMILVAVHEFGHYSFARFAGIRVLAFSIGFGPKLVYFKTKETLWSISLLPLGGYCKMAGEENLVNRAAIAKGDIYYGSAWRRLLAVIGGPFFSLLFALVLFFCLGLTIKETSANDAKIIAITEQTQFVTGDVILTINNKAIKNDTAWYKILTKSANKTMHFTVLRDNQELSFTEKIPLASNGIAILPIVSWIPPVVTALVPNSVAEQAGLEAGDTILQLDDTPITNSYEVVDYITKAENAPIVVTYQSPQENSNKTTTLQALYSDQAARYLIGIEMSGPTRPLKGAEHISIGLENFIFTLSLYTKSIASLFQGAKLSEAISGPAQTTYLIGTVVKESLAIDIRQGITILAFVSLALGVMNLLPIPLLDGGLIVLYLIEWLRGSKITSEKTMAAYRIAGLAMIAILFTIALKSDILHFINR